MVPRVYANARRMSLLPGRLASERRWCTVHGVCLDLVRMRSLLVGVFAPLNSLSLSVYPRRDSCNRFTYLSLSLPLYFSIFLSVGVRPPLAQSIAYRHRDRLVGIIVIPGPGIAVGTRRQCSFGRRGGGIKGRYKAPLREKYIFVWNYCYIETILFFFFYVIKNSEIRNT